MQEVPFQPSSETVNPFIQMAVDAILPFQVPAVGDLRNQASLLFAQAYCRYNIFRSLHSMIMSLVFISTHLVSVTLARICPGKTLSLVWSSTKVSCSIQCSVPNQVAEKALLLLLLPTQSLHQRSQLPHSIPTRGPFPRCATTPWKTCHPSRLASF